MDQTKYLIPDLGGPPAYSGKPTQVSGSTFFLDERYQIQDTLNDGHNLVISARDAITGETVAIKKSNTS